MKVYCRFISFAFLTIGSFIGLVWGSIIWSKARHTLENDWSETNDFYVHYNPVNNTKMSFQIIYRIDQDLDHEYVYDVIGCNDEDRIPNYDGNTEIGTLHYLIDDPSIIIPCNIDDPDGDKICGIEMKHENAECKYNSNSKKWNKFVVNDTTNHNNYIAAIVFGSIWCVILIWSFLDGMCGMCDESCYMRDSFGYECELNCRGFFGSIGKCFHDCFYGIGKCFSSRCIKRTIIDKHFQCRTCDGNIPPGHVTIPVLPDP